MMDSDGQHYYGPAICPKCNLTVYHAEWVVFNSEAYHQSCFVCADCRRNLNSANAHRAQGKLLCKACFSKGYGMTGYGYGGAVTSLGGSHGGPGGKAEQPLTAQAHCYPQLQQMQQAVDAYDGYPGAGVILLISLAMAHDLRAGSLQKRNLKSLRSLSMKI
jgi:hypothetical protein